MKAFDRSLFQRAIHPFDLRVGLGMGRLRITLHNGQLIAKLAERMVTCLLMMGWVTELSTIVNRYLMRLAECLGQYPVQKFHRDGLGPLRP